MKKLITAIIAVVFLFLSVPMLDAKGNTWSREKRKIKGCFIEAVDHNYNPVEWWYKLFEQITKPR
jgi:hypothetical protein